MYLILIYIILIFILILSNDYLVEGQSAISEMINLKFEYQDRSKHKKGTSSFNIELSKNTKIEDIIKKIYKKNQIIDEDLIRLKYNGLILNNINTINFYIENMKLKPGDTITITNKLSIDKPYKDDIEKEYNKFYKSLTKFSDNEFKTEKKKIIYNDNLSNILKNVSIPVLNSYKNNYIKDANIKKIKGLDNKNNKNILNESKKYKNNNIDNKYQHSRINIEQNIFTSDMLGMNIFERPRYYESSSNFVSYNKKYLDYMEDGENKFKYLNSPFSLRTDSISF